MTTEYSLNVPNLDAMEPDELMKFCECCENLGTLARYKAAAMRAKKYGDVSGAEKHEALVRELFGKLPASWRW